MIDLRGLRRRLKGKSLGELYQFDEADKRMPWAYQKKNPDGRWLHNDHGIMTDNPVLKALQPWQRKRRVDHTYMLPLPLELIKGWGGIAPEWMPWQEGYQGGYSCKAELRPVPDDPSALSWQLKNVHGKNVYAEVLAYHPNPKPGQAGLFGVRLDGELIPCFYTSAKKVPFTGKQFQYYYGLKPDMTWGDFMLNWPEASAAFKDI